MNRRTFVKDVLAAIAASTTSILARPVSASSPTHHTIEIREFEFSPPSIVVEVGDRITWINQDIVPHTATAADGSWDTGEIAANARAELVVRASFGESYYCRFHPSMQAALETS